jgi:Protein of unknown function (DUF1645)
MSTAEELFFNGLIRPGFVYTDHASVPHPACIHRRTRSVSPTQNPQKLWREQRKELAALKPKSEYEAESNSNVVPETKNSDLVSASTSRSSSSNSSSSNSSKSSSRRWGFIKDLLTLQRSKSEGKLLVTAESRPVKRQRNKNNCTNGCEGSGNGRGRLTCSASFSPGLCKQRQRGPADKPETVHLVKEARRRRRTTFLPYKQQGFLFGWLGFSYSGSRGFVRNVSIPIVTSPHS